MHILQIYTDDRWYVRGEQKNFGNLISEIKLTRNHKVKKGYNDIALKRKTIAICVLLFCGLFKLPFFYVFAIKSLILPQNGHYYYDFNSKNWIWEKSDASNIFEKQEFEIRGIQTCGHSVSNASVIDFSALFMGLISLWNVIEIYAVIVTGEQITNVSRDWHSLPLAESYPTSEKHELDITFPVQWARSERIAEV